jgi:hypothetical protein
MTEDSPRQAWLMRGTSKTHSLMFALSVVVEPDGDLFSATVTNMDQQMAAIGRDEDEAFNNALTLFRATVDDCLRDGFSVQYATGQKPLTFNVPVFDAPKFFHLLEQQIHAEPDLDEEDWLALTGHDVMSDHHAD